MNLKQIYKIVIKFKTDKFKGNSLGDLIRKKRDQKYIINIKKPKIINLFLFTKFLIVINKIFTFSF